MAEPRVFSKSLSCVPKFTSADVVKSVKMHLSTIGNKLDKRSTIIKISLDAESVNLKAFSCSCAAGKGFCNHIVAILFQTTDYSQLGLQAVPPPPGLHEWLAKMAQTKNTVSWWCKSPKQLAGTV